MTIFIDTSALYALLDAGDNNHQEAKKRWIAGLNDSHTFTCHNYVIVETVALLQNRIGIDCVRSFIQDILPVISIIWVDQELHSTGLSSLAAASKRDLSFVDCVSFSTMIRQGITEALVFDRHFEEQGFKLY